MFALIFTLLALASTGLGFALFFYWFVAHRGEWAGVHPDAVPSDVVTQQWVFVLAPLLAAPALFSVPWLVNLVLG